MATATIDAENVEPEVVTPVENESEPAPMDMESEPAPMDMEDDVIPSPSKKPKKAGRRNRKRTKKNKKTARRKHGGKKVRPKLILREIMGVFAYSRIRRNPKNRGRREIDFWSFIWGILQLI